MLAPLRGILSPLGVSAGVPFTPRALPDLVQWFDADQAGGVDGVGLATLPDLSPNGFNGTQVTAGKRPLWIANAQNGHAAIRSDGVDDWYNLAGMSASSGSKTFIACLSAAVSAATFRYLFDTATGRLIVYLSQAVAHNVGYYDGTDRPTTVHTAGWQVLSWVLTAGVGGQVFRNGTSLGTPGYTSRAIGGATGLFAQGDGAGSLAACDLGGWIVCNGALSGADRLLAETYYKTKYGIS